MILFCLLYLCAVLAIVLPLVLVVDRNNSVIVTVTTSTPIPPTITTLANSLVIYKDSKGSLASLDEYGQLDQVLSSNGSGNKPTWRTLSVTGVSVFEYGADSVIPANTLVQLNPSFPNYSTTATFLYPAASTEGSSTRMSFNVAKSAFRAGVVSGSQWNNSNCGLASVAFGSDTTASGDYSGVGGGLNNTASGSYANVGGGESNVASGSNSTVGGGYTNTASGTNATVGGGNSNSATNTNSVVAGGISNTARGAQSGIMSGENNTIDVNSADSIIGSGINHSLVYAVNSGIFTGDTNSMSGTGFLNQCFIGGGQGNIISSVSNTAVENNAVAAGEDNKISGTTSVTSNNFIGAGHANTITNSQLSTILNGDTNIIHTVSTCCVITAGNNNTITGAQNSGIFCGTSCVIGSTSLNSVVVSGNTNSVTGQNSAIVCGANHTLVGNSSVILAGSGCALTGNSSIAGGTGVTVAHNGCFAFGDSTGVVTTTANDQFLVGCAGGATFFSNTARTTGVAMAAGASSWAAVSDRNQKENIVELDYLSILDKFADLPIYEFSYKNADPEVRCRGPMAQDWHGQFPSPKKDPLRIDTLDLDGITLAILKGLLLKIQYLESLLNSK